MNNKFFLILLLVSYLASFLRFFLSNNFLTSIIGSFLYGYVISRKISKSKKEILLIGFCSCFTSFSGFVNFLYQFTIEGYYLKLFFYLNLIVILNVFVMYFGFLLGRKMN